LTHTAYPQASFPFLRSAMISKKSLTECKNTVALSGKQPGKEVNRN